MPRLPVDGKKVIEHRITFGTKERQLMEGALGAFQFNKVSTPIVAGMSDVSFMITFGAILTLFFPDIILPRAEDGIDAVVEAIKTGINQGQERAKAEREATGEATLDDSTGARDFLGRLFFNVTNPNWGSGGSGVREAWGDAFG